MKRLEFEPTWPDSWQQSWQCDSTEVWGSTVDMAYTLYYQRRFRAVIDDVRRLLPAGASVLDIAGAHGNFSLTLAEAGYVVTWNDLACETEGYVRLKYERGQIAYSPGN